MRASERMSERARERRRKTMLLIFSLAPMLPRSLARADDLLIPSLTIEDYTAKAVQEGTNGRLTALALESAGYTREISFRQTDSPNATVATTHTRGETKTNGVNTLTDTKSS